jgi:hypothetical protein
LLKRRFASEKDFVMSVVVKLMIFGWCTTFAMIGICALNQSGKLLKIRKRIASWLEPSDVRNLRTEKSEYPGTAQAD